MENVSEYEKIREETRTLYSATEPIFSPALNEYVHFTAEGFNHFLFKGSRVEREVEVQIKRFGLFSLAKDLIGLSTTYQEYEERYKRSRIKMYKERIRESKTVLYWGIIAIINDQKIKVVLRKAGSNGQIHFWSIIPDWITSPARDSELLRNIK